MSRGISLLLWMSALAWGYETAIWKGEWATHHYDEEGIKNLLLSIERSPAIADNDTNVFINFPLKLVIRRRTIASKEDFLERFFKSGSAYGLCGEKKEI